MGDTLDWNDVDIEDEEVTEADINNAENSGRLPPLRFLATCDESTPREAKMNDYTGYEANLKWNIEEALEVGVFDLDSETTEWHPATDEEKEQFEGRSVFDSILLPHPSEADWAKNRRVLVAKRCGLITNASDKLSSKMWASDIIGVQVIITTEGKKSTKDPKKVYINVKFDGYESLTDATEADDFDDI